MIVAALLLIPTVAGLLALRWQGDASRRVLLVAAATLHTLIVAATWCLPRAAVEPGQWLGIDPVGLLFLSVVSVMFLATAVYSVGYLAREQTAPHLDFHEGIQFTNEPESIFTGCLLLLLASMTLVTLSQHFGLLWVAIETTTLSSAPLIYFHRHHRSLEATWKYLLICSVGIALALLGNFLLAVAANQGGEEPPQLFLADLTVLGPRLNVTWLNAAFLFFLVGYGTKMGIAPLHTWLPDSYAESPSAVGALFSGALANCAFLGILRAHQVCVGADQGAFSESLLLPFGLASMAVAAAFIMGQTDFMRMLAYSSVEHVGIMAVGIGLGGAGAFGSMLHTITQSLTKGTLFLVGGVIVAAYGTRNVDQIRGVTRRLPIAGMLLVGGFLAITGSPPFGPFVSELTILKAALDQGHPFAAALYLCLATIIFVSTAGIVLNMAQGESPASSFVPDPRWQAWIVAPPLTLGALVLLLGLYVPPALSTALHEAATALGGS